MISATELPPPVTSLEDRPALSRPSGGIWGPLPYQAAIYKGEASCKRRGSGFGKQDVLLTEISMAVRRCQ